MEFEERPISSKTVFHGHLIDVEVQQVITPHGNRTQREIVHHAPAIAILALTADNKMILEKQLRKQPLKFLRGNSINGMLIMHFMRLNAN